MRLYLLLTTIQDSNGNIFQIYEQQTSISHLKKIFQRKTTRKC